MENFPEEGPKTGLIPQKKKKVFCLKPLTFCFITIFAVIALSLAVFLSLPPEDDMPSGDVDPSSINITFPTAAPSYAPPSAAPSTSQPTGATCNDGAKDSDQTDLDCGGEVCSPCGDGLMCLLDRDCRSTSCNTATLTCDETITRSPSAAPTSAPTRCQAGLAISCANFITSHAILWIHNTKTTWDENDAMNNNAYIKKVDEISPGMVLGSAIKFQMQIPPGEYGVMLIDDENHNGELDTNFIGLPTEGVGASRGAAGGPFGGPKWDDAKFTIECGGEATLIPVELWKA
ncbi:hypothetical protein ScalyP_jg3129 [Parmales sp. scaly parma]|nr:hypothetical protein ScalyP_jg3129 [Parmales sp. scaly parma]